MSSVTYDVIIIGSGPAGLTAGIYTSRANLKTLILAGSKWGGQLQLTTEVENFPGFPAGILGPDLMKNMRDQAKRFGSEIIDSEFVAGDFTSRPFKIKTVSSEYLGKALIVATGADTKWLGVPGEEKFLGRGVSSCAPCDAFFYRGKKVIVVGGGDSAMEEASFLTRFATSVVIVHRTDRLRASKIMQDRAKENPKINYLFNAQVVEILGSDKVEKVVVRITPSDKSLLSRSKAELKDISPDLLGFTILTVDETGIMAEMPIDGIFVAIGHIPNTTCFKGVELDARGFVKRKETVDFDGLLKYYTSTNVDGVFTAGDVHDYRYKQAVTAAGFGCMAALDVEKWLEEKAG